MSLVRSSLLAAALAATAPLSVSIASAQDESALEPVVVTATRQRQRAEDSLASVHVLERADIERAGHSSLIEVLRALPGLQVTANGGPGSNSNVYIRGAESRHTLLLIDGIRVGSASSGAPALENLPLGMIERIEILRGPASALYGSEAIGGVIQVFTRRGEPGFRPEVFVGYGTYDSFQGQLSLSGGVGRIRYSLTAGQEHTEGFNSKRDPAVWAGTPPRTSYWDDDDGFRSDHLSGSLSLGFRDSDEIGVSFTQADARNWYDASATSYFDAYLDKWSSTASVFLRNALSAEWTSTLRVGQSEERSLNRTSVALPSRFDTRQDQLVWQHDIGLPVGGLMLAYEYVESTLDSTSVYRKDSRRVNSAVLGWSAQIDTHHLQLNVRHDDNSQFGGKTTGMLAYGYDLGRAWRVHGSVATAFNAPTFNQLYWPMTSLTSFHGNPDLKPEQALNREIGVRWSEGAHMLELNYFNNRVKDLIASNPAPALRGQQINIGEASLEGVEIGYLLTLGRFSVATGVDFLEAKDENNGLRLPRRARRTGFVRLDHAADKLNWGVELNGAGRRHDDAANTVELHGYGLLNAYAHYRFAPDWRVEMRANNILDKDYELARGYRTPGSSVFVGVRYAPR